MIKPRLVPADVVELILKDDPKVADFALIDGAAYVDFIARVDLPEFHLEKNEFFQHTQFLFA